MSDTSKLSSVRLFGKLAWMVCDAKSGEYLGTVVANDLAGALRNARKVYGRKVVIDESRDAKSEVR